MFLAVSFLDPCAVSNTVCGGVKRDSPPPPSSSHQQYSSLIETLLKNHQVIIIRTFCYSALAYNLLYVDFFCVGDDHQWTLGKWNDKAPATNSIVSILPGVTRVRNLVQSPWCVLDKVMMTAKGMRKVVKTWKCFWWPSLYLFNIHYGMFTVFITIMITRNVTKASTITLQGWQSYLRLNLWCGNENVESGVIVVFEVCKMFCS